ncbi:MAG: GWxTD domain-containing protein [Bacteroidota bacterium]
MKLFFGLLILLGLISQEVSAQSPWECAIKKGLDKGSNTRLFLAYKSSSNSSKNFKVDIRFRPNGKFRDFLRKESRLTTIGDKVFIIPFNLPIGEYEVDISIEDLELQNMYHLEPGETYTVREQGIEISDIYLSYNPEADRAFEQPLVDLSLEHDKLFLHYFYEIQSDQAYSNLSLNAFLFKDVNSGKLNDGLTSTYESLYESSKNINLNKGEKVKLADMLEVEDLSGGEYLLSVDVFNGATRLAGVDTRFVIGGDIKQQIRQPGYLDDAILMMEYILPLEDLEVLLDNPDFEAKKVAFDKSWKELYGEEADIMMEAYYSAILDANKRYKDDLPGREGWQSDRGRIYIEYGEPEIREININGRDYQRWIYAKWSLAFLFEKRNKGYYLIE